MMVNGNNMQFCLKWNNFGSTVTLALKSLYEVGDFIDVTLAAEGLQIGAHKLILSACSAYFREILKTNPCQHPVIILRDISSDDLKLLLTFIYEGEVHVADAQLHSFMQLAEFFQISGLAEVAEPKLKEGTDCTVECSASFDTKNGSDSLSLNSFERMSENEVELSNSSFHNKVQECSDKEESVVVSENISSSNLLKRKRTLRNISKKKKFFPLSDDSASVNRSDLNFINKQSCLDIKLEPEDSKSCNNEEDCRDKTLNTPPIPLAENEEPTDRVNTSLVFSGIKSSNLVTLNIPQRIQLNKIPEYVFSLQKTASDKSLSQPEFPSDSSCQNLPYPCPFCDRAYTSWGFRRRHIKGCHTSSPHLPCKWCFHVMSSHKEWEEHVTKNHSVTVSDARNGLLILEEAHMVLQISEPTRIDSLVELIKNKKNK